MLTRLENIPTFQSYEKWKVGEKLGSKAHPCYIRIRVITNRVISRFKCINMNQSLGKKLCLKYTYEEAEFWPVVNKISISIYRIWL